MRPLGKKLKNPGKEMEVDAYIEAIMEKEIILWRVKY